MKKLSQEDMMIIERQLYNRSRDIDVAIYNGIMDEENKDFVLDCLMLYMNRDGGFGSGLYIDNYNPESSVYQTYEAFRILDSLGYDKHSANPLFNELVNKSCNYLFNKCLIEEGAWNPTIPSNEHYAHSEEMNYQKNFKEKWGYFPTAPLLGYILLFVPENKAYYKKALKQIGYALNYFDKLSTYCDYDLLAMNQLLKALRKNNLFDDQQEKLEERLCQFAEKNESVFIPQYLSNCQLSDVLKQRLEAQLDSLIDERKSHGLWEHKHGWQSNRYPEADSAALKWIGAETVRVLAILKQYGRIEK